MKTIRAAMLLLAIIPAASCSRSDGNSNAGAGNGVAGASTELTGEAGFATAMRCWAAAKWLVPAEGGTQPPNPAAEQRAEMYLDAAKQIARELGRTENAVGVARSDAAIGIRDERTAAGVGTDMGWVERQVEACPSEAAARAVARGRS